MKTHVEAVVVLEQELDLGGEVTDGARGNTEEDGGS